MTYPHIKTVHDAYGNTRNYVDMSESVTTLAALIQKDVSLNESVHLQYIIKILNGCSLETLNKLRQYPILMSLPRDYLKTQAGDFIHAIKFEFKNFDIKPLHPKSINYINIPATFILLSSEDYNLFKVVFSHINPSISDLKNYIHLAKIIG